MSDTATTIRAGTPLLDQGIRAVNFFNGRLVTSRDLGRDQDARREGDARLGQGLGAGVVQGLEVQRHGAAADRRLQVRAGLGFNRAGQSLCLGADQVLALVPQADEPAPDTTGGFGACQQLSGGSYVAGDGLYLVTLAPVLKGDGRAEVLALEPGNLRCNTDVMVEGVQLRLLRIGTELLQARGLDTNAVGDAAVSRLRSAAAAACFGDSGLAASHAHPGQAAAASLLDDMRDRGLDDCDLPLALVYLNASQGLVFVDRWAVRRHVAGTSASETWAPWVGAQRQAVADARLAQFQEQLADLPATALPGLAAVNWFASLPPAGFLDADGSRAVDWQAFLGARAPVRTVALAPGDAPAVLAHALQRDAVSLDSGLTRWRVYRITGGPWFFVRDAPNVRHAEEVWLDGTRAHLSGVQDVQSAIDALRARCCQQLVVWPGADLRALIAGVPPGTHLQLCFEPGVYELDEPLVLAGLGDVSVHGAGSSSSLRCARAETALRVEGCASLSVRSLDLQGGRASSGKDGESLGLLGALTVLGTPGVQLASVSARCAANRALLGAAAIVVHMTGLAAPAPHRLNVSDCRLSVAENQLGLLCVDCDFVQVRGNDIRPVDESRPMQRGIVIAGRQAQDLRIEDNVVAGAAQGISVGLSQKEDRPGDPLQAERVVVACNTVQVALNELTRRSNRFGVFVGNAKSVLVQANRVAVPKEEEPMEGVRLSGVYGPHVIVRDNHSSGCSVGIGFSPREVPLQDALLWFFEGNLAEGGREAIHATPQVWEVIARHSEHNEPSAG